ncbi:hypothetical protein [Citrobacter werkmanii]|uniref:hypothetical protein n=1 Tax=Citrobacter werkmanii TaxID=67827 RepID=UPI003F8D0C3C
MTTNHPAHGPVSLDRLHQISEILSKAAAQSDGGNLGYAMADAVKVIDGAIAAFGVEPVAWIAKKKTTGEMELDEPHAKATNPKYWTDAFPVYSAPPAQLFNTIDETLIEALRLVQCMLDDYRERNYGHAQEWIRHISAKMDDYSEQHGDDAYSVISAAMLQAGNSPVTPDGWQLVPKEPTEEMNKAGWAAMNEHDAINPTYRAMLAAAPQQEAE